MPGFHFNEMGEMVLDAIDDIGVVDVYDLASDIGKEYEKIIDHFGTEAATGLMPKIINTLELLEALATKNERENATIQELKDKIAQLESEKSEKAEFRRRFEKELEMIEEQWRTETNDLADLVSSLQEENKRLVKQTQDLQSSSAQSSGLGASLTESIISITNNELHSALSDTQVLQRLKEQIYRQRDELKEKERELQSKYTEIEHMTIQMDRLKSSGRDTRRRCTMLQTQVKTLCEERADFLAQLQDQCREINSLRKRLGLAEKDNEDLYMSHDNDPNRPRYTTLELKELINERDELLTTIENLNEELRALKPTEINANDSSSDDDDDGVGAEGGDEDGNNDEHNGTPPGHDAPVQGPLPFEPDDAPWKKSNESGIRKFFRKLFSDNNEARGNNQTFQKRSLATLSKMALSATPSATGNINHVSYSDTFKNNAMNSDEIKSEIDDFYEDRDDCLLYKDYLSTKSEVDSETNEDILEVSNAKLCEEETDVVVQENYRVLPQGEPLRSNEVFHWGIKKEHSCDRNIKKRKRNSGQEYFSPKIQKTVEERKLGPSCNCKRKCRKQINNSAEVIFKKFWQLGSYELQNSYLFGCIDVGKKKRTYKKKMTRQQSRRKITVRYSVSIDGFDIELCKVEFMSLHGLQNSEGRINQIVKSKKDGAVVPKKDGRGKHNNRPSRLGIKEKNSVRDHINMIPKYQNHYCRANNIDKTYLNHDMSISSLYKERYIPWCKDNGFCPVRESAYRKIFRTEYNIGFKLPKSYNCKHCEEANNKSETATQNNSNRDEQLLTAIHNEYKNSARSMQYLLKTETVNSIRYATKCVISFDLQQALPIPKLTIKPAFYCRKVWLYNLGIHDCTAGQGHMYVWTENIAKCGADEVISVLLKYIESKTDIDDLVIFTGNCPNENNNQLLMSFWLQLVKEKRFKTITHHFLVNGNTSLPSYRDFALIEKSHTKCNTQIYTPEGWHQVIKDANHNLMVMTQEDFFDFGPILDGFNTKPVISDLHNTNSSGVYIFHFKAENPNSIFIKSTFNEDYKEVNILKKETHLYTTLSGLKKKYTEPIKIAYNKLLNIKSLLTYIPSTYHTFYNSLRSTNSDNDAEIAEIIE